FAGHNCKCQDPSGTGPQWDSLTEKACNTVLNGETENCVLFKKYHADQHHQCSCSTNCMASGGFNDWCAANGAPGAYCWN
ncbi:hypothetical protein K431DRAFT_324746, partial [Polychaeton citri CBS 116435]